MAPTIDVKAYADAALEQGKRAIEQAQHVLTEVPSREGKALIDNAKGDLEAFLVAVEPYVAQAKQLPHALVDRTEELVGDVRKDRRVAKAYGTAESLADAVRHTVSDKVVAPALGMVGRKPGGNARTAPAPVTTTPAPAPTTAQTAAAKKPEAKAPAKAAAKKTSATTAAGRKAATKTAARKSPATKPATETATETTAD
jgi:hypothetical protein